MAEGTVVRHIVSYSGGIGSYMAAKRVVERYGPQDVTLLFADTKMEDEDLYRFLHQGAGHLGAELVKIADGRTPWQVYRDRRFLGNSRVDPCSEELKRDLLRRWFDERYTPDTCVKYIGIDWSEEHRLIKHRARSVPWVVEAPMCEPPFLSKAQMLDALRKDGIEPPRLYKMGFPHNNCGGFCCKAGQSHFALLLRQLPDVYAKCEAEEKATQEHIGKPVTILRDRRGKRTTRLSLTQFRERIEAGQTYDLFEWGGCGCALD